MLRSGWALGTVLFLASLLPAADGARADDFKITPSISFSEEYNDNVLYTTNAAQSDFVSVISPGLLITEKTERLDVKLSGRADRRLYNRYSEFNATNQFYDGSGRYRLTERSSISGSTAYTIDSDPDRDLTVTGLPLTNVKRTRQTYSGGGEYLLSEKTAASFSYQYQNDRYDSDRYTDLESHTFSLGFIHDISCFAGSTKVLGNIGYARYNMLDPKVDNFQAMAGIVKQLNEKWNLRFDGGTRYTRSKFGVVVYPSGTETEERSEGWGAVGRLSIAFKGERDNVEIAALHDLLPASGRSGASERTSFTLTASRRFTYELYGTLFAGYYINHSSEGEFSTQEIDENSYAVRPGLRYEYSPELSAAFYYTHNNTRYNVSHTEVNRNLFMFRLTFRHNIFE